SQNEQRIKAIAKAISVRLGDLAFICLDAGEKIAAFVVDNGTASQAGHPKKKVSELVKDLKPYWKRIIKRLDVTPGGAQAGKYIWTPQDVVCLNTHYQRLKPIWREAKKAAKQALKAKE